MIPRSRGGTNDPSNIIRKDIREHAAYHQLFGNMTIAEIVTCILCEWTTPEWRKQNQLLLVERLKRLEKQIFPET